MKYTELAIEGTLLVTPDVLADERGRFLEEFNSGSFEAHTGRTLPVAQLNLSVSHLGAVRGMHSYVLPGQCYYMICVQGAVLDVVLDIRVGSPTFGEHVAVTLDADRHQAMYVAEGLAHGFAPLTDGATIVYLATSLWRPGTQFGINPLDPRLGLPWPRHAGRDPLLSEKDRTAPSLAEARERGMLPSYADCRRIYRAASA
ncbi:dTDP-4-dehydrorhamnose 3,5-epimerase family protein [Marinactinospora thermotolerans]|uniref:dTDP-4-dehydrorhamnose 3,5-epimerase n=1 Tax=Marinactinospora thermotolerans DSM 45154 TaxID=1122192 RepID=A0A1T4R087_9ACTN|nr:dTDP-4-dehydrorhamnose 3,5-epimerase family protein [Marinactinospora thermotolerans]SKA09296.1 dTDP-4-dehydrorhamnose 3,5-epimerase [Marinactinospora thermotolerans DSM 45154]